MDNVSRRAQDAGHIRTLLGRRCRFHLWEPNQFGIHKALPHDAALREHGPVSKRAYTYKALNKLIQGSAADMTKKAMIELSKAGILAHIQVHDELDISVKDDKQVKQIVEIMESAVKLEIPNRVDFESGSNWGHIKQGGTMEHINNAWAKVKAHPKIAAAVAVVIVVIIIAA